MTNPYEYKEHPKFEERNPFPWQSSESENVYGLSISNKSMKIWS